MAWWHALCVRFFTCQIKAATVDIADMDELIPVKVGDKFIHLTMLIYAVIGNHMLHVTESALLVHFLDVSA